MLVDWMNLPREHETTICVNLGQLARVLDTLYYGKTLDRVDVRIGAPLTCCTIEDNGVAKVPKRLHLTFISRGMSADDLLDLWHLFRSDGFEIVWKHSMMAHVIGPGYTITKTWELGDG